MVIVGSELPASPNVWPGQEAILKAKVIGAAMVGFTTLSLLAIVAAGQSVPGIINYQGRLTDSVGMPVNGNTVRMHFAFLDGDTAGSQVLWGETNSAVKVTGGLYNVILGSVNPIPSSALAGSRVFLEVQARGEVFAPRQRLTSVPYALNAEALSGATAGAYYSKAQVDALIAGLQAQITANANNIATHTADIAANTADIASQDYRLTADEGDIAANAGDIAALTGRMWVAEDDIDVLGMRMATAESNISALQTKLASVSVVGNDFIFTGVNVNIRNGTGATGGGANGRGNLIVGYNELRGSGDVRTGSHNLIVGRYNNFGGAVGIVVGEYSSIGEDGTGFNAVIGGSNNSAKNYSSVFGGFFGQARTGASVGGGNSNTAQGWGTLVSGGNGNSAINWQGSPMSGTCIFGGEGNSALNDFAGYEGSATVVGGSGNYAHGMANTVCGGMNNKADPLYSQCSGYPYGCDRGVTVSGGFNNQAFGKGASISGGMNNQAYAGYSSISGGYANVIYGDTVTGICSSISGGYSHAVSGNYDWMGGGLWQDQ
jgi:hypothetical protein